MSGRDDNDPAQVSLQIRQRSSKPDEADSPADEDDAGRIAHAERVEIAKRLLDFVRLAMKDRVDLSRLADSSFVRRLYQDHIKVTERTQRVAALEASAVQAPDVPTMETIDECD